MKYPLEQLALIKKKKLDEAEKVLAQKKQELEKEQNKLNDLIKKRDVVREHKNAKLQQLRETLDEGTTSDKIAQMKQYLKEVEGQLKTHDHKVGEQQKVASKAEEQVENARREMFARQKEVEKLKLHRKEWEKQVRREEERKAEVEIDEIGSMLYTRKDKKERDKDGRS